METKDILQELRKSKGLSQEELAAKFFVTRQAVSRWECGETMPNIDMLKKISKEFGLTIDELLGGTEKRFCQSCGMPMQYEILGNEDENSLNGKYCKWCYTEGKFITDCTMEEMIEECIPHMGWQDKEKCREFLRSNMAVLERWK